MTLLIHFLMCLTTMFEREVPADEASPDARPFAEESAANDREVW